MHQIFFKDDRPASERVREQEFVSAVNRLKTLRVTPDGGMSIDAEEIREQVIATRRALKQFVR
ncbi:hypothetical protein D3C84_1002150 [compost metagenome]